MNDLVGDIEGDLAALLRELDVEGDLAKLMSELDVLEQRDGRRTHVSVGEHRNAIREAIEARDAEMIAAINQTINAMTQSIMRAIATPREIVRDPLTNRVDGSRPAVPVSVDHGADPAQLANASPSVRALYSSLMRLAETVAGALGRPKRVVRDADGRPHHIE